MAVQAPGRPRKKPIVKKFDYTDSVFPTFDIDNIIIDKYINSIKSFENIFTSRWANRDFKILITNIEEDKTSNNWTSLYLFLLKKEQELWSKSIADNTHIYNRNRIKNILDKIISEYQSYGYTFKYFTFLNENSYLYQININDVEVTPDTFETGITMEDVSEDLKTILFKYELGFESKWRLLSRHLHTISSRGYIGWSKQILLEALEASELFQEIITPVEKTISYTEFYIDDNGNEIPTNKITKVITRFRHDYPNLIKMGAKPVHEETIYFPHFNDDGNFFEEVNVPSNLSRKNTPHLYLKYLPKFMLEQLYYLAYSPKLNIDKICDLEYIDTPTIRRIMEKYTKISHDDLRLYQKNELCDILKYQKQMVIIRREIPETSSELILQPGGKMYLQYLQQPEQFRSIGVTTLREPYRKYYNNCANPNVDKTEIIFDVLELGLGEYINRNMSKIEICDVITKYLESLK